MCIFTSIRTLLVLPNIRKESRNSKYILDSEPMKVNILNLYIDMFSDHASPFRIICLLAKPFDLQLFAEPSKTMSQLTVLKYGPVPAAPNSSIRK